MSPERFGPFFDHVCEVVHAAHQLGVVHRDIKSSNIMVVPIRCESAGGIPGISR
jgi:serine/threonine protein kinase